MVHHILLTTIHKIWVMLFILLFCCKLIWRGITHDLSKYSTLECKIFSKYLHRSRGLDYGSKEYDDITNTLLAPALKNHYKKNRHHIQFHPNGIHDFTLVDLVEFFCDNLAACKRQPSGNIDKSIDISEKRFAIDHQIAEILHNEVKSFK